MSSGSRTPSFETSEVEKANVKFIKIVEKYPCIWKKNYTNYNQKEEVDKAWSEIAKEMCDTPKTCLIQWQKIRRAYSRTLKIKSDGTCQKSKYYLANSLEFVRPYLSREYVFLDERTVRNERGITDSDDSSNTITCVDIKAEPEDSNETGTAKSDNDAEMILYEIMKMEDEADDKDKNKIPDTTKSDVDNPSCSKRKRGADSIVEVNKTKEAKDEEKDNIIHPSSSLIDANRKFFESLIPFIDEMNTQQNRRFRREIMCLIDDVLDDRDINVGNS